MEKEEPSEAVMETLGRILLGAGLLLVVAGGLVLLLHRAGLPLGELPGDFSWERGGTRVFVPLGTMLVLSVVLTLLVNLVLRIFR